MTLENYQTLIFDCDGVVLNSNKVKTNAFYKTALPFGEDAAKQLVTHHISNGGISRYKKFEWFVREVALAAEADINVLLNNYSNFVRDGLLSCEIARGLDELRKKTSHANWLIVSGGDQEELREIFSIRNIGHLFDGGIFGSPESKHVILAREIANSNIANLALFIGDSQYDYESAVNFNLDFIFLKKWSEFSDYNSFFKEKNVRILNDVNDLRDL